MEIFTTKEFAELHQVSPQRIRKLAAEGRIYPCRKIHRNWIFTAQSTIIPSPQRSRRELEKLLSTGRTISHAESTKLLKELRYYLDREHEPLNK